MSDAGAEADVRIRAYRPEDRDALYEVCLRTGDVGRDATALTGDPTLLGEIYVGPYLEAEPELALVAELDGVAAGYALGALDTTAFESWCDVHWWAPARARHPTPPDPLPYDREQYAVLAEPRQLRHPSLPGFPSHLHIDLLPGLRGAGVGRSMMHDLFVLLAERGSPGVHLGVDVRNVGAQRFYERLGFVELVPDDDGVRYLGRGLGGAAEPRQDTAVS